MIRRTPILAAIALSQAPVSLAGIWNGDCREPRVFTAAAVNVIILPYTYPGSDRQLINTSRHLGILLQLNTLLSLVKYGSVGVVQLENFEPGTNWCDPGVVEAKVNGPVIRGYQVGSHRALVLLWGRIYEEGGQVFVRSYTRFLRRDADERTTLRIGNLSFSGTLPAQSLSFGAARLSRTELEMIDSEFDRLITVYDSPNGSPMGRVLDRHGRLLERRGEAGFAFHVVEVRGDWMRIVPLDLGPRGWIHANPEIGTLPLGRKMPELSFLEGISGYLRMRVAKDREVVTPPRAAGQWAESAFERFLRDSESNTTPLARAVVKSANGILETEAGDFQRAQRSFEEAAAQAPFSVEARNLAAIGQIYLAYHGIGEAQWKQLSDNLIDAAEVDPHNADVLLNLENYYRLLLTSGPRPNERISPAELGGLRQRLASVERIHAPPRPAEK
jgi:tetratricopeptide (TPR) repeat protein